MVIVAITKLKTYVGAVEKSTGRCIRKCVIAKGDVSMASYIKRGDSYRIKVNTKNGCQYLNWKPDQSIAKSADKVQKELNRQMVLFEEKCKQCYKACNIKFEDFMLNDWYINYAIPNYKISYLDRMQSNLMHIKAEIGDMRLDEISKSVLTRMIQSFAKGKAKNTKNCLCAKTINNILSLVSAIFEYAKDLEIVEKNPVDEVRRPSDKPKIREYYSIEDTNKLFDILLLKAPMLYQAFYILALYSGMRVGEISALKWSDINEEAKIINVTKTVYDTHNKKKNKDIKAFNLKVGKTVDIPKTLTSIRSIKVPEIVFEYLKKLKELYKKEQSRLGTVWKTKDKENVFRNQNGNAVSPYSVTKWLGKFTKRHNLKHLSTHDFRHLYASLLIYNKCDVKALQALLGHSKASTTLDSYAYLFKEMQVCESECISEKIKIQ